MSDLDERSPRDEAGDEESLLRLIFERAALAGAVGLVPIPVVDDLLSDRVRGTLLRRIAEVRAVGVHELALETLAAGRSGAALDAGSLGALATRRLRRRLGRAAVSLVVLHRLDETLATIRLGLLFDHYCRSHHAGPSLDAAAAAGLRGAMDRAARRARGRIFDRALAQGLALSGAAARALPRLGLALIGRAGPAGALAGVPDPGASTPSLAVAPSGAATAPAPGTLRRVAAQLGLGTSALGRAYAAALRQAFDAEWPRDQGAP